jgi:hypothetical protein
MKYINTSLILLFLIFRSSCLAEEIAWGRMAQGIRCSISSSEITFKKGIPAPVTIIIENRTIEEKTISVTAGFNLGRMEYWAPVKLGEVSEHLEANDTFELALEAGELKRFQVDLAGLKWGKSISSAWPYRGLFSAVKSGRYKLSFNIYFDNNSIPNWIRSNEIDVTIVKTNKKTDLADALFQQRPPYYF